MGKTNSWCASLRVVFEVVLPNVSSRNAKEKYKVLFCGGSGGGGRRRMTKFFKGPDKAGSVILGGRIVM